MNAVAATSEDLGFIDRVLESWSAWARDSGLPHVSHTSARYSTGHESLRSYLMLDDRQFGRVDRAVARLGAGMRAIIQVHYRRDENESKRQKARLCDLTLRAYEGRLAQAQAELHYELRPDVYDWQALKL